MPKMAENTKGKTTQVQDLVRNDVERALYKSEGYLSKAAEDLNCTYHCLKAYVAGAPSLQKLREGFREARKDVAEEKLFKKVETGRLTAIIFFLKTVAKDRGYIEGNEPKKKDDDSDKDIDIIVMPVGPGGQQISGIQSLPKPGESAIMQGRKISVNKEKYKQAKQRISLQAFYAKQIEKEDNEASGE